MRNSDLLEQLQQKDVTYVYNLSGHNVLNSLINLNIAVMEISMKRMEKERISFFSLMLLKG